MKIQELFESNNIDDKAFDVQSTIMHSDKYDSIVRDLSNTYIKNNYRGVNVFPFKKRLLALVQDNSPNIERIEAVAIVNKIYSDMFHEIENGL